MSYVETMRLFFSLLVFVTMVDKKQQRTTENPMQGTLTSKNHGSESLWTCKKLTGTSLETGNSKGTRVGWDGIVQASYAAAGRVAGAVGDGCTGGFAGRAG